MVGIIKLFDEKYFKGRELEIHQDVPDLVTEKHSIGGNWNDETLSFKIISGQWELYEHSQDRSNPKWEGPKVGPLGKRDVPDMEAHNPPMPKEWLSALRKISD